MDSTIIDKYSNMIWKYVHSFSRRFDGFKNSPLIDKDDLYQECAEKMIELFVNSGSTAEEFEFDHMQLYHAMHLYVKKCLPVKTTVRTSDFKKHVCKYAEHVDYDSVKNVTESQEQDQDDVDFKIDCDRVEQNLDGIQKKIFRMARDGHTMKTSVESLGITYNKFRWHQLHVAKSWNKIMRQNRLYYGKKV